MSLSATVLFDLPQKEVASLVVDRIARSTATSIVTGFATPGGLTAVGTPIKARPQCLKTLVIGAATYPGFEALDELVAAGVPMGRLHVHLGHSSRTGTNKHPYARYHPMLHSKVYYMELPDSRAAAFIGSHNLTSFALQGMNGEAAVMLEGPVTSPEFDKVRSHIKTAQTQAVSYVSGMKEAYAWWTSQYIDGLNAEMNLPHDWTVVRTILLFVRAERGHRPKIGDQLYFEIPAGIEQIESLRTETHLFLFDSLPSGPMEALQLAHRAVAKYTCKTLGAENRQGNRELVAQWRIDGKTATTLVPVPSGIYRPATPGGMQQVRAEVETTTVVPLEYLFERERKGWDPELSAEDRLVQAPLVAESRALVVAGGRKKETRTWNLVKGLTPRLAAPREKDEAALKLAAPDSGSFILVSLRRRPKSRRDRQEGDSA